MTLQLLTANREPRQGRKCVNIKDKAMMVWAISLLAGRMMILASVAPYLRQHHYLFVKLRSFVSLR